MDVPPPSLSVCIIARDEERHLPACLASAAPIADQIVVVDTGSVDRTPRIARAAGADVLSAPWRDDFSAARNASLDAARGRFVLWLDADERIPHDQVGAFRRMKAAPPDRAFGIFLVNRLPGRCDERWLQVRMFPNDPRIRFERRVHEQVAPSIERVGFPTFFVDVSIEHLGYAEPAVRARKALRNRRLLELDLEARPDDPYQLSALADSYFTTGEFERGIETYRRVHDLPEPRPPIALEAAYAIAHGYQALGLLEESLRWFDVAVAGDAPRLDALVRAGEVAIRAGDEARAIGYWQRAADVPAETFSPSRPVIQGLRGVALVRLAQLAASRGDHAGAGGLFRRCQAAFPQIFDAYLGLAGLLRAQGRPSEAAAQLQEAVDVCGDDVEARRCAAALIALSGAGESARHALQGAIADPREAARA